MTGKKATPPPRLCPPPTRGASFMASWTLRLPQLKPTTRSVIPQLHIDQNRKKNRKRTSSTNSNFTRGVVKHGVVLESAEATLSPEYPQQSMEVEALLYSMEISDNMHHYSSKTTLLPQLSNGHNAENEKESISQISSPGTKSPVDVPPPTPIQSPSHKPSWRYSMTYSSIGELANHLLLQDQ